MIFNFGWTWFKSLPHKWRKDTLFHQPPAISRTSLTRYFHCCHGYYPCCSSDHVHFEFLSVQPRYLLNTVSCFPPLLRTFPVCQCRHPGSRESTWRKQGQEKRLRLPYDHWCDHSKTSDYFIGQLSQKYSVCERFRTDLAAQRNGTICPLQG